MVQQGRELDYRLKKTALAGANFLKFFLSDSSIAWASPPSIRSGSEEYFSFQLMTMVRR